MQRKKRPVSEPMEARNAPITKTAAPPPSAGSATPKPPTEGSARLVASGSKRPLARTSVPKTSDTKVAAARPAPTRKAPVRTAPPRRVNRDASTFAQYCRFNYSARLATISVCVVLVVISIIAALFYTASQVLAGFKEIFVFSGIVVSGLFAATISFSLLYAMADECSSMYPSALKLCKLYSALKYTFIFFLGSAGIVVVLLLVFLNFL
ncbi:MAG: hypothetical protein FWG10_05000 [Eubacteriaceae bacterium]|nr:hypothetical protein [Eubacteriaceae bacterium]